MLPNRILCFKWLYILSQCAHWVSTEWTVLSLAHRDTTEKCAIPNAHALMNSVTHRLAAPINMVWPLCWTCLMNIIIEVPHSCCTVEFSFAPPCHTILYHSPRLSCSCFERLLHMFESRLRTDSDSSTTMFGMNYNKIKIKIMIFIPFMVKSIWK